MTKTEILAEMQKLNANLDKMTANVQAWRDHIDKLSLAATELGSKIRSAAASSKANREAIVVTKARIEELTKLLETTV